jgi:hypothetical protein
MGLTVFLEIYKNFNSIISLMVFLNGILFHMNYKNKYLKYYDILFNLCTILFLLLKKFHSLKIYFLLSISIYLLNSYFFESFHLYNRDISDLIHIVGVQYILSLGLIKFLKKK